ncbi:MAG: hypothetical protein JWL61_4647 [Gemmatimonadetes bacterium]|jgi:hypothetical protein|nr:hypothetical protein [Gemmatimonadota bacterium]
MRIRSLFSLAMFAIASPLAAQRSYDYDDNRWLDDCRRGWNGNDDRGRACEVKVVPVKPSGRALDIDGRQNGSIRVMSWNGDSVRVTARMQANARSDKDAEDLLKDIRITSDGRRISAEGPRSYGRSESWSVSYVVFVPRRYDLDLEAQNGSLGVTGVVGKMDLRTQNGSVHLEDIGGDVRARTQNGSLNVQLEGGKWEGAGLDAETENGSVRIGIPSSYAAQIETGTVNGRMSTDFPITVQGRIGRRLSLPLNGGGVTLRAITTNGSVSLSRK